MSSENTNKIATNTLYLYLRQGISMIITFATVGVTLDVLGETDYGINNVIAGTVSMFTFLSGSLAVGNQRFYAYYLGKNDMQRLKEIVGGTIFIYLVMAGIFFILGESIGLWILNHKLVIPAERLEAANWLYQFGIISLCFSMLMPPFSALLTAHENMRFYAAMTIWDSAIRLITLYLLVILPFDKLIALGAISLSVTISTLTFYIIYVKRKYPESRTKPIWRKDIMKELLGFNCWNLCGNLAWMIKNQGTGFLLNMFFGPVVNAAQGIATGVRGMSQTLSDSFKTAMTPQITKSYAQKNYEHLFRLAFSGSKLVFLLMAIVVIPAIFNIELILDIWLPHTPKYTVVFCQIMLVEVLLEQTSSFLATINQATGKIKSYQLLIGFYGCLNLPVAYLALRWGCTPEWVFVISLFLQLFVIGVRIGYLKRVSPSSSKDYIVHAAIPCIIAGCIAAALCFIIPESDSLLIRIIVILIQIVITASCVYVIALSHDEKDYCRQYTTRIMQKVKVKNITK